ncbi:MAG: hypothetical protein AABX12_03905 [Nanoarchaeota archaeon]
MAWHSWLALIGGVLAVVGEFWTNTFFLSTIGGVLAVIAGISLMMGK